MRRIPVFFYGLFMDTELLVAKGVETSLRPASLRGFELRIGRRATLVPSDGTTVHGVLAELTHLDIDQLYSDHSVQDYRPEAVLVETDTGESIPALASTCLARRAPRNETRNTRPSCAPLGVSWAFLPTT